MPALKGTLPASSDASLPALRKLGIQAEPHLARALMNLGEVQTSLGRTAEADATLRESVALREKHPEDLWELAEARERLGDVTAGRDRAAAAGMVMQPARDLESQLGATHPQTLRAKSASAKFTRLAAGACRRGLFMKREA